MSCEVLVKLAQWFRQCYHLKQFGTNGRSVDKVSEYDQVIPQSHTADQPTAS